MTVSAQFVGDAFVEQYYQILHHSPTLVHKFYQDVSRLGRPEKDGSMSITTTMEAIKRKILSLNYGELRAVIKSVDAQESINSGIIVLVTGNLTGKDNITQNFTQSFFLAPQEMGYYVLNDVFRYVEKAEFIDDDDYDDEVLESAIEIEEMPKKSYASIITDMDSNSMHTSKSEFLEIRRKNMAKKMESDDQSFDFCLPTNTELEQNELFVARGEEYKAFRKIANQHWDLRKSSRREARTARRNGKQQNAADLFEEARLQAKRAREADERASQNIFTHINKKFKNTITIDLHGQHVKQAMWHLKRHLGFGTSLRSIRFLKVITGYGSKCGGKSKIKPSVINFLKKEGVEYEEENKGTLKITLDGDKEFGFLDRDIDIDIDTDTDTD